MKQSLQNWYRIISITALILTIFAGIGQATDISGTPRTSTLPGSGTPEAPYLIYTKEQLDSVRQDLTACYQLQNDLTFTASDFTETGGWTPIGFGSASFSGTFDGQGHAIYGLSGTNGGLFHSNSGSIRFLRILDHTLHDDFESGAIANQNSGTIEYCYVRSAFTLDSLAALCQQYSRTDGITSARSGGITGKNSGTIQYCRNDGLVPTVTYARYATVYTGGIAGYSSGTIQYCYNSGTVASDTPYAQFSQIGGITCGPYGVNNCRNDGAFYTSDNLSYNCFVSGIISYDRSAVASNCVATPMVLDRSTATTGSGVAQYPLVAGSSSASGSNYLISDTADTSEYPLLDFDTIWMMTENGPVPQGVMDENGRCTVIGSTIAATCTTDGIITYTDLLTGTTVDSRSIPATGHSYTIYTSDENGTCQGNATESSLCDNGCGSRDTRTLANSTTDHKYTVYTPNGDATCTQDGTKTAHCDYGCNTTDTVADTGSKLDHEFSEWQTITPPTYITDGEKMRSCSCTHSETDIIPATGPTLVENISVFYDPDIHTLSLTNVPEGLLVVIGMYCDKAMVAVDVLVDPDSSCSAVIPGDQFDTIRIFFLYTGMQPIGHNKEISL